MHESAEENAHAVRAAFANAGHDIKDLTAREAAELADKLGLRTTRQTRFTVDTMRALQKRFGGPKPSSTCGAAAHARQRSAEYVAAVERREAARVAGAQRYEGRPCPHGHTTRYVSTNTCAVCFLASNKPKSPVAEPKPKPTPAVVEPPRYERREAERRQRREAERRQRREAERLAQLEAERRAPIAPSGFNAGDAELIRQAIAAGKVSRARCGQWRSNARLLNPFDWLDT